MGTLAIETIALGKMSIAWMMRRRAYREIPQLPKSPLQRVSGLWYLCANVVRGLIRDAED